MDTSSVLDSINFVLLAHRTSHLHFNMHVFLEISVFSIFKASGKMFSLQPSSPNILFSWLRMTYFTTTILWQRTILNSSKISTISRPFCANDIHTLSHYQYHPFTKHNGVHHSFAMWSYFGWIHPYTCVTPSFNSFLRVSVGAALVNFQDSTVCNIIFQILTHVSSYTAF